MTALSGPGVETLSYVFKLKLYMRSKNEVMSVLQDARGDIVASLARIERLRAANKPKAVLAERIRLAEIRRQGRHLLLELEKIEASNSQTDLEQGTAENR